MPTHPAPQTLQRRATALARSLGGLAKSGRVPSRPSSTLADDAVQRLLSLFGDVFHLLSGIAGTLKLRPDRIQCRIDLFPYALTVLGHIEKANDPAQRGAQQ